MKKIVSFSCFLAFTFPIFVHAGDYSATENLIKQSCQGFTSFENFFVGSNCSGSEATVYYVKDKKVSKAEYDIMKAEYDKLGPICEETQDSKLGELPDGLAASCVKGSYGVYSHNGSKITYSDFIRMVMVSTFSQASKDAEQEANNIIAKKKEILQSRDSFLSNITSENSLFSYSLVGSKCDFGGSMVFNGNGYKDMNCKDGKIVSMKYIFDNKEVSSEVYIDLIYNLERKLVGMSEIPTFIKDSSKNSSTFQSSGQDSVNTVLARNKLEETPIASDNMKLSNKQITSVKTGPEHFWIGLIGISLFLALFILGFRRIYKY